MTSSSLFRSHMLMVTLCLSSVEARAQNTIHVPADQTTIQSAINAAADGDTILVAPGTYKENISFMGKAITVTSAGGASQTTIDGGQNGVVVSFTNHETRQSVLNGFTITDDAPPLPTQTTVVTDGILVTGASPAITNNIITGDRGFGIEVDLGAPLIQGNTISYTATAGDPRFDFGCDYLDGSAIFISGMAATPTEIVGNLIEHNKAQCFGGAIRIDYATGPIVKNNIIRNNVSIGFGGAISLIEGDELTLVQNLIYNNNSGTAGGGLYLSLISEVNYNTGPVNLFIVNNTIVGNTITINSALAIDDYVDGSQIAFGGYVSQIGLYNNIIEAADSYGAIACYPGFRELSGIPPFADHNDVLNSGGPRVSGWCPDQTGSNGNISADPKFSNPTSGDFHLQAGSSAIDSGDNSAPNLPNTDLDSNARIQNATGLTYPVIDMGAFEASGPSNVQATQVSLSVQPSQLNYGNTVNFQANVTAPSGITSGTVGFFDSTTQLGQSSSNIAGVASFSTSGLNAGTHLITAAFSGNSSLSGSVSRPTTVVVVGEPTSLALNASATQITFPQSVTLTATVASANGTPAGNVTLYIGPQPMVSVPLNAQGSATYTFSNLDVGNYSFSVQYPIQGPFASSTSPTVNVLIQQAPTSVSLTATPNPAPAGQPVTFTATVQSPAGIPIGNADFNDGTLPIGSTVLNANGISTITVAGLAPGTHSISATYANTDGDFAQSTSQVVILTVNAPPPDFSITTSPGDVTIPAGQTGKVTLIIAPVGGYAGSISFGCSGLPTSATCSFSPSPLNPTGNNTILTTNLTVSMPAAGVASASKRRTVWWHPADIFVVPSYLFGVIVLLIASFRIRSEKSLHRLRLTIPCVVCAVLLASCGGGSSNGYAPPPPNSTTYTVLVTATGENNAQTTAHSATLMLTVTR
ncbi:MAG: Ig-like domain repeat protein [Candidatus Acidiferrales bacterium]